MDLLGTGIADLKNRIAFVGRYVDSVLVVLFREMMLNMLIR